MQALGSPPRALERVWGGACELAFLTRCQVRLLLSSEEPTLRTMRETNLAGRGRAFPATWRAHRQERDGSGSRVHLVAQLTEDSQLLSVMMSNLLRVSRGGRGLDVWLKGHGGNRIRGSSKQAFSEGDSPGPSVSPGLQVDDNVMRFH